jgi:hypothetical protein
MANDMRRDAPGATQTRPDPDPTVLTTAALLREIGNLRGELLSRVEGIEKSIVVSHEDMVRVPTLLDKALEQLETLMDTRIRCAQELSDARFSAMDKAIALLQVINDRSPAEVDRKIMGLQKLHEEKFASIANQFSERDVRTDTSARDSKVAVDAALQAAKEAVGVQQQSNALAINKSETTTKEQITALGILIQSNTKNTDEKIDDIKQRLTRIEGTASGHGDVLGWIIGVVGAIAAAVSIAWYIGHLSTHV